MDAGLVRDSDRLSTPEDWARTLSRPPLVDARMAGAGADRGLIRRWRDTAPEVSQPALDVHLIVAHLGGPKHVERRSGAARATADISCGDISIIPAGAAYGWSTRGPIDYAHFYLPRARLDQAARALFDRTGRDVSLTERFGCRDALLIGLFGAMLAEASEAAPSGLYLETLAEAFVARLLRGHSNLAVAGAPANYALAPRRLSEVKRHIEANLATEMTLGDLAEVARLSRFHFARAFHRATGSSPYDFIIRRRIETAKDLLQGTRLPIEEVARRTGFASAGYFATRFGKIVGLTPSRFRRDR
jgi:AraC family transcriptional regulator